MSILTGGVSTSGGVGFHKIKRHYAWPRENDVPKLLVLSIELIYKENYSENHQYEYILTQTPDQQLPESLCHQVSTAEHGYVCMTRGDTFVCVLACRKVARLVATSIEFRIQCLASILGTPKTRKGKERCGLHREVRLRDGVLVSQGVMSRRLSWLVSLQSVGAPHKYVFIE